MPLEGKIATEWIAQKIKITKKDTLQDGFTRYVMEFTGAVDAAITRTDSVPPITLDTYVVSSRTKSETYMGVFAVEVNDFQLETRLTNNGIRTYAQTKRFEGNLGSEDLTINFKLENGEPKKANLVFKPID